MQELIGDELIEVEIGCKEEMQLAKLLQVELTAQNQRCQESNDVDEQQILCYCGYVTEHLFCLRLSGLRLTIEITLIWAQNYEKYLFSSTKNGQKQLFFMKKVIFFGFLFVL